MALTLPVISYYPSAQRELAERVKEAVMLRRPLDSLFSRDRSFRRALRRQEKDKAVISKQPTRQPGELTQKEKRRLWWAAKQEKELQRRRKRSKEE